MIKLLDILTEAKIVPITVATGFNNSKHPAVYNFVKANKEKILQAIKKTHVTNIYGDDEENTFEDDTDITDIANTIVDDHNFWEELDEQGKYPNGQEIIIYQNKEAVNGCRGITISNMGDDIHNELSSGNSFKKMPEPYGSMGLYYEYMWC